MHSKPLQWCTHNALHPNLNICTRTRNALGLYQIPFNKVKEQCTPNALLRTRTHSMSAILACTANALFNRKGSHYLNQYWLIINEILSHAFQGDVHLNIQDINPHFMFEIYTFEISATSLTSIPPPPPPPPLLLPIWSNFNPSMDK